MSPLELVKLKALMALTSGRSETVVGLIDGPIAPNHPDLTFENIQEIPGKRSSTCVTPTSNACIHGTYVAGILCAKRHSGAPAICANCTLLLRPLFSEAVSGNGEMPNAPASELAEAILECVKFGAWVINLSAAVGTSSSRSEGDLRAALDYAARNAVIVVAAAGNQGLIASSAITSHPWVIPVVACDSGGKPISDSNLARSIGKGGLTAPGQGITSLAPSGKPLTLGGTSAAAPFVTGTIALLWSAFSTVSAYEMRAAVTGASRQKRTSLVPPLLDAWAAFQLLQRMVHHATKVRE